MSETVRAGSFLLATPSLIDPNFRRAAVLICENGNEGSMGLVINRPLQASLAQLFTEIVEDGGDLPEDFGNVFAGGPVETSRLLVIQDARNARAREGDHAVGEGLVLVNDVRAVVESIARREQRVDDYRFMLGYSGWGERQLEGELSEDSWIVRPANCELVFDTRPDAIWATAMREIGGVHRLYAEMPVDPSVN